MDRDYTPAGADILAVIHYTVDGTPHTVQVKEFPFRIGRDSSAVHLTLHDPKVSRTHAVLFCRDGGVWLENLSATNGTEVNGARMEEPVELLSGDEAVIGSTRLVFEIGVTAPADQAPTELLTPAWPEESSAPWPGQAQEAPKSPWPEPPAPEAGPSAPPPPPAPESSSGGAPLYCRQCGAKLREGALFCGSCGARVPQAASAAPAPPRNGPSAPPPPPPPPYQAAGSAHSGGKKPGKHRLIGILAIVAAVAVILALAFFLFGGRSLNKALDAYVKASFTGDAEAIFNLFPEPVQEAALEEAAWDGYATEREALAYLSDQLQSAIYQLDDYLGEDWTYSYEVVSREEYDKAQVQDLVESLRSEGATGFNADAVTEVELEITLESADGSNRVDQSMYLYGVKDGRSWYIVSV